MAGGRGRGTSPLTPQGTDEAPPELYRTYQTPFDGRKTARSVGRRRRSRRGRGCRRRRPTRSTSLRPRSAARTRRRSTGGERPGRSCRRRRSRPAPGCRRRCPTDRRAPAGAAFHVPDARWTAGRRPCRPGRRRCSRQGRGCRRPFPRRTRCRCPAPGHVPDAGGRPEDGDVGLAVAVVVGRDGDVAGAAPRGDGHAPAGELHEPLADRRPEHGPVGYPVAAVVGGHGDVAGAAPRDGEGAGEPDAIDGRYTARSVVPSPSKSPGGTSTTGLTVTNWFSVVRKAVVDTADEGGGDDHAGLDAGRAPVSAVGTRSVTSGNMIRHRSPVGSRRDPFPPGGVSGTCRPWSPPPTRCRCSWCSLHPSRCRWATGTRLPRSRWRSPGWCCRTPGRRRRWSR